MENVIVTGATGVTGIALVRFLLEKRIHVTAFVRPGSFRMKLLPSHPGLRLIECGMEDYKTIANSLSGDKYDVFYHLAWEGSTGEFKLDNRNNMYLQNRNVTYSLDAVELCRQLNCPVFIATGSQAEYGRYDEIISEDTMEYPENGYGSAKLCAGQMTRILCKSYGIRHIWARLFSVYGPYDGGTVNLIQSSISLLQKEERPKYTLGIQEWDYLFSYDAANALWLLSQKGKGGQTYCIAQGMSMPLSEYIKIIHEVVNPQIIPIFGEIPYGSNPIMNLRADITKLKKDTGFKPEYDFRSGIGIVSEWSAKGDGENYDLI